MKNAPGLYLPRYRSPPKYKTLTDDQAFTYQKFHGRCFLTSDVTSLLASSSEVDIALLVDCLAAHVIATTAVPAAPRDCRYVLRSAKPLHCINIHLDKTNVFYGETLLLTYKRNPAEGFLSLIFCPYLRATPPPRLLSSHHTRLASIIPLAGYSSPLSADGPRKD